MLSIYCTVKPIIIITNHYSYNNIQYTVYRIYIIIQYSNDEIGFNWLFLFCLFLEYYDFQQLVKANFHQALKIHRKAITQNEQQQQVCCFQRIASL